ncbi:unnamed protein product, partial [Arabidopsis halleri]
EKFRIFSWKFFFFVTDLLRKVHKLLTTKPHAYSEDPTYNSWKDFINAICW